MPRQKRLQVTGLGLIHIKIISGCVDCVGEGRATHSRFSMPLAKLGEKKYYLGIFFKVKLLMMT